jgi:glycosyltransferase involved in cell wall biosynthesis
MRLLLVGAFPYPLAQGSQVYFQEQAAALRAAGADVELLTYASGEPSPPDGPDPAPLPHHRPPQWTAPSQQRSGPSWGKPLADLALAIKLRRVVVSRSGEDAFDAVVTHNAEACLAALLALPRTSVARVYCVHTLLGHELSTYLKPLKSKANYTTTRPLRRSRWLDRLGRRIDRALASRVDGWIALSPAAHRVMRQYSTRPGELIPPAITDPEQDPNRLEPARVAQEHGLELDGYFLYSGNLDGYQELELLAAAAALITRAITDPQRRPVIVLASHDPRGAAIAAQMPGVTFREVASAAEMQALLAGARANLLMRRAEGGFPIKLVNALAVGTPTIAFREREWGLRDGENSMIISLDRPAASLAAGILKLAEDDNKLSRLRIGARALYRAQHQPASAGLRTLTLIEAARAAAARNSESTRSRERPR